MSGGRTNAAPFDPTKKLEWFTADFYGLLATTFVVLLALLLFFSGVHALMHSLSVQNQFLLLVVVSVVSAFVIVFCLRRNITVIGGRRQFRYFCRWF